MKPSRLCRTGMILMVFAIGLGGLGCDDPSIYKPDDPVLPLSNQRIIGETVMGMATLNNSIYRLRESDGGSVYFSGRLDDSYLIGKTTRTGQIQWQKNMTPSAYSICPVPANNIGLTDGVLSVGALDSNADDRLDQATIRLTGVGGSEIDELIVERTDADVYLLSISAVKSLSFVVVGGAVIDNVLYPFVATFAIGADSMLTTGEEVIFLNIPGQDFLGVRVDPAKIAGDEFGCYVTARVLSNSAGAEAVAVHAFSGSLVDSTAYSLEWSVDITPDRTLNSWGYINDLELYDGAIYFCGAADIEKESNPSNGYWNAGFIGSVSVDGQVNWKRFVTLSKYGETYYGFYVTNEALYVSGVYSSYTTTSNKKRYGLALVSIFDRDSGQAKYHLGLGSKDYRSGFNTVLVEGTRAYCAGWTNNVVDDGGSQAWFVEVSLDNLPITNGAELQVLLPAEEVLEEETSNHKGSREVIDPL